MATAGTAPGSNGATSRWNVAKRKEPAYLALWKQLKGGVTHAVKHSTFLIMHMKCPTPA